jgi:tRNA-specific 2-thiouridylase
MSQAKTVVVGLSGGVDSAVSAHLLKEQGYRVIGIFMKNWEDDDDSEYCSTRRDFLDAAAVADVLGIELQAVNFAAEYKDWVFADFLREYQAGRTPNPDVLCNAEIKFKAFLDHAFAQGADFIATGHYARVRRRADGLVELLRGLDESKDQSYFLHRLNQIQLDRVLFPVGEIKKTKVRQIADQIGLPNAKKKDSTGICFIGERPFREFLNRYLASKPGPILMADPAGHHHIQIGTHQGLSFYTLGQSKGLGIGGVRLKGFQSQEGKSWYVCKKDMATNTLYVSQDHDHPWLMTKSLTTVDACWVSGQAPEVHQILGFKTRYRQADASGHLVRRACGAGGASVGASPLNLTSPQDYDGFSVVFDEPQWAVTPGQSVVVYDGEVCLGGGIIA